MADILYRFTSPNDPGDPTSPGETVTLYGVESPQSPAHGIWQAAFSSFSGDPDQHYIANDLSGVFAGIIIKLREWIAEGKSPVEVSSPRSGLYGHRTDSGWVFVSAYSSGVPKISGLVMTCDWLLSDSSINFYIEEPWRDAIIAASSEPGRFNPAGFGALPRALPAFWTAHVMTGEDGVGSGGAGEFVDLPLPGPYTGGSYAISLEVQEDLGWRVELSMDELISGPANLSGMPSELIELTYSYEAGGEQSIQAAFDLKDFRPLSDPLTGMIGRITVEGVTVEAEAQFYEEYLDGSEELSCIAVFLWRLDEPTGWSAAGQVSLDITAATRVQP